MYARFIEAPFVFDLYFENELLVLEINKSFLDLNLIYCVLIEQIKKGTKELIGEYKQSYDFFGFSDAFLKIKEDDKSVYFKVASFKDLYFIAISLNVFLSAVESIYLDCVLRKGEYKIQSDRVQEFWISTCVSEGNGGFDIGGICSDECLEKILNLNDQQVEEIKNSMLLIYGAWNGSIPSYERYAIYLGDNVIQINYNGSKGTWLTIGSRYKKGEISGHNIDYSCEQIILLGAIAKIRTLVK